MNASPQPVFPILAFPRGSVPCLIHDEKQFSIWPISTFKEGLIGIKIIDKSGAKFIIKKALKKGYPGLFLGYSLLSERVLRVEIVFKKTMERMSAKEIKELIIESLEDSFSENFDEGFDKDEAEQFLSKNNSVADIIEAYERYLSL